MGAWITFRAVAVARLQCLGQEWSSSDLKRAQEDSNPHLRIRNPVSCPLDHRHLVPAGRADRPTSPLSTTRRSNQTELRPQAFGLSTAQPTRALDNIVDPYPL